MTTQDALNQVKAALLHCPFCGGEAEKCEDCDGYAGIHCPKEDCLGPSTGMIPEEMAVAIWSTRVAQDPVKVDEELLEMTIANALCQAPKSETVVESARRVIAALRPYLRPAPMTAEEREMQVREMAMALHKDLKGYHNDKCDLTEVDLDDSNFNLIEAEEAALAAIERRKG